MSHLEQSAHLDADALASPHALAHLASRLRTIPDFPKQGIQFKDITPLLADAQALHMTLDLMAQPFIAQGLTHAVAIEARGFIFGGALAARLNVGFIPVRKPGKLPAEVDRLEYALEYGTGELQMHKGSLGHGARVLIVDDVLATGGTAAATAELVRRQGGQIAGFAFVCELNFLGGRSRISGADTSADTSAVLVHSLLRFA